MLYIWLINLFLDSLFYSSGAIPAFGSKYVSWFSLCFYSSDIFMLTYRWLIWKGLAEALADIVFIS